MYVKVGNWNDFQTIMILMKGTRIKKAPRCTWIEDEKGYMKISFY